MLILSFHRFPSIPSAGPDTYPIPPVWGHMDVLPALVGAAQDDYRYAGSQFESSRHSWRTNMPDKSFFSYFKFYISK